MTLPRDPYICMSVVNTKLRDGDGDLAELCAAEDLDRDALEALLLTIGYVYDREFGQFIRQKN